MTCVQNAQNYFRMCVCVCLCFYSLSSHSDGMDGWLHWLLAITVDSFGRSTSIPSSVTSIICLIISFLMLNGLFAYHQTLIIIKTLKLTIFFTLRNCRFASNLNRFFFLLFTHTHTHSDRERVQFGLNFNANKIKIKSHNLIFVLANG